MKNNKQKRFLETITFLGDNILIPIDRIIFISIKYTTGWEICIKGDNNTDLSEHFGNDEEKAFNRFQMIKDIIEAG